MFNGQESVLWKNLRKTYFEELKAMYQTLRSEGTLSYAVVERMFEEHQAKWPENIFNEDAYFKYLAPLVDDGDASYLSMLQGSKAEQRKWWLYNRFRYMDSKYNAGDSLTDVITLRAYAKGDIAVTPYADIYCSVKYASYLVQERGARGSATVLTCPLAAFDDTEIYIYSASQIASVGDLSDLMVGYANFSYATRLQSLVLGKSNAGLVAGDTRWYDNGNLQNLYLGNNTMLRLLDVRHCSGLGKGEQTTVDISGCTNIREVYFDGTSISALTLPEGGILRTLHLPATITALKVINQTSITDFTCPDTSSITTLWLDNVSDEIDALDILSGMAAGSRVRLFNFSYTVQDAQKLTDLADKLDTMRGIDQSGNNTELPQLYGTIHCSICSNYVINYFHNHYPNVTITYDSLEPTVYYYDEDGVTLVGYEIVEYGEDAVSSLVPVKPSTIYYTYTFTGWAATVGGSVDSSVLTGITEDVSVYAVYSQETRYYTVLFYQDSTLYTLIGTATVTYGESAETYYDTDGHATSVPTYQGSGDPADYRFSGWSEDVSNITQDMVVYANFIYSPSNVRKYLQGTLSIYTDDNGLTDIGPFAFAGFGSTLTYLVMGSLGFDGEDKTSEGAFMYSAFNTLTFGNGWEKELKEIEQDTFRGTTVPASYGSDILEFPMLETLGRYALNGSVNFSKLSFPHVTSVGTGALASMTTLTYLSLGALTNFDSSMILSDSALTTLLMPAIQNTKLNIGLSYLLNLETLDVGFTSSFSANIRAMEKLETLIIRYNGVASFSTTSAYSSGFLHAASPIAQGTGYIYVPSAYVAAYQVATGWKTYSSQFRAIEGSEWEIT